MAGAGAGARAKITNKGGAGTEKKNNFGSATLDCCTVITFWKVRDTKLKFWNSGNC